MAWSSFNIVLFQAKRPCEFYPQWRQPAVRLSGVNSPTWSCLLSDCLSWSPKRFLQVLTFPSLSLRGIWGLHSQDMSERSLSGSSCRPGRAQLVKHVLPAGEALVILLLSCSLPGQGVGHCGAGLCEEAVRESRWGPLRLVEVKYVPPYLPVRQQRSWDTSVHHLHLGNS